MTKQKPIFRRVDSHKYSKLGVRRKKKIKYRFPRGRDNKIRLNKAGRLRKVKIGFKDERNKRGLINNKKTIIIHNVEDLKRIKEEEMGILGKTGDKNKKSIAEELIKCKLMVYNFNASKFLKDLKNKMEERKKIRNKKKFDKITKDKKNKEKIKKDENSEKLEKRLDEKKNDDANIKPKKQKHGGQNGK